MYKVRQGYIAIYASGGHLSGSLEKAWNQTKKMLEKIKGKGLGKVRVRVILDCPDAQLVSLRNQFQHLFV